MKSPHKKQKKQRTEKLKFVIDHVDPLGQGVDKGGDKNKSKSVTFIPKTLPEEKGVATVHAQRKGVQFARLEKLTEASPHRIDAECPHFDVCSGCHYLHTDYAQELAFKQQALTKFLRPITDQEIQVVPAESRFHYRNRMQLHYRHQYIGLLDGVNDQVVEVPECKLPNKKIQQAFDQVYANKSWANDLPAAKQKEGHCEIYTVNDEVKVSWNGNYASGGFSQVNDSMNALLQAKVKELVAPEHKTLLDLFSGQGNLSDGLDMQRVMSDYSPCEKPDFYKLDLFAEGALKSFRRQCPQKTFDVLLVDPPRKGFPDLAQWVKHLKVKQLIYVSCNGATMARDLQSIAQSFAVNNVVLLDMFPGTHHFETVVSITLKK